ncbi:MAG TPA: BamA/TamA family outer membrane protein [Gemmatimonadota bacterium]|nr:BamA/TamA family outer membrane protein [Gemmatimonadota bacterium]
MSRRALAVALLAGALATAPAAGQERRPSEPIPFEPEPAPRPPRVQAEKPPLWLVEWPGWHGLVLERYNRTDGLVAGFGAVLEPTDPARAPAVSLRGSTPTTHQRLYWHARARQRAPFPGGWAAHVVVDAFHRGRTYDDWKISTRENDFTTFLVGSDQLDWWRERGWRLAYELESERGRWAGTLALLSAEQHSQAMEEPFVLIGAGEFRPNPPVEAGTLRSLSFRQRIDTRNIQSPLLPAPGWLVTLEAELAGGMLGGDIGFAHGFADVRRYIRIGTDAWWDTRLVWIESDAPDDEPVPQRHAMLGGPGSLRGFRAAEFIGADAVQVNTEVRIPLPVIDPIGLFFLSWHWVAFADAGSVDDLGDWHADVGMGISGINIFSYVGVFVAQRVTDRGGDNDGPRLVVRLRRDF